MKDWLKIKAKLFKKESPDKLQKPQLKVVKKDFDQEPEPAPAELTKKSLIDLTELLKEIKGLKAGATAVVLQESWYRDQYKRTLMICLVISILLLGSLIANTMQIFFKPEPKYFATTNDFRLAELTPLDQPVVSQIGLLNWTTETITRTFTLDFSNWRRQLMEVRSRYSNTAFKQLVKSLEDSGNLAMIKNQRLVTSCTITEAPVILAKGIVKGKMTWKIEFPMLVSYESSKGVENTQKLLVNTIVQRADTTKKAEGIHIIQLLMRNR
ncbi:hypothetical protein DSCO28_73330 (plasmid) [Desulfosarcina ovata subsp. sediminis]|uniref:Type IV secretion system protein IcmL n=1 Tax=Desulfosarcina ovata subsp. sediminis TaxID=885957 RepID=A0A5K8A2P6_9BACT|nr:DotI/IcmL/TraM family protein [Desulfosarcina ovata]BBO86767.1 hypothetical protein DSCO28_73330 [Desulfosarcina ovata subsp. sediminis]